MVASRGHNPCPMDHMPWQDRSGNTGTGVDLGQECEGADREASGGQGCQLGPARKALPKVIVMGQSFLFCLPPPFLEGVGDRGTCEVWGGSDRTLCDSCLSWPTVAFGKHGEEALAPGGHKATWRHLCPL